MFLDGCKIYLSGFCGAKLEKLRKIINSGGGTRFNQINEIVSHVIVGDKVDEDFELLRNCEFHIFVVGVQWILDSAREGKKLAEESKNIKYWVVHNHTCIAKSAISMLEFASLLTLLKRPKFAFSRNSDQDCH